MGMLLAAAGGGTIVLCAVAALLRVVWRRRREAYAPADKSVAFVVGQGGVDAQAPQPLYAGEQHAQRIAQLFDDATAAHGAHEAESAAGALPSSASLQRAQAAMRV